MKSKSKINIQKYSLILILIAMMVVCSFLSSNFFTTKNLTNILKQVSIVTICAFAQGMIIICGEIDLSIGYLAGMAGSYACIVYVATENLVIAFLVGILLGALVGAINGLFVAYFKLPSFIVTLAMQTVSLSGKENTTIMATTCCRASGMASWNFGTPFSSKILPRFIVSSCFRSAASPLFLIVCPLVRRNHLFLRSFVLTAPNNRHCAYIIANYYQKNN